MIRSVSNQLFHTSEIVSAILAMAPTPPEGVGDITKVGETLKRSILRSYIIGTVLVWFNKWGKKQAKELIVKHFVDHLVFDEYCKLSEVCGLSPPKKHINTHVRSKGEATAYDLVNSLAELDLANELPEIVVPAIDLQMCPTETMTENEPTILTRLETIEMAMKQLQTAIKLPAPAAAPAPATAPAQAPGSVPPTGGGLSMASLDPAVRTTAPAPATAASSQGVVPASPRSFGSALERANTLSRSRENGAQSDRGMSQAGKDQSWAGVAAAGRVAAGIKRGKPTDSEGFVTPGRPSRKQAPRGSSKVDLSGLGNSIVAPIERYVGNTSREVTAEVVRQVLIKCSEEINGGSPLEIIDVKEIGTEFPNKRTRSWQVTVPYKCRELMMNPDTYPQGWTHRAYFAPRVGNKRAKPGVSHNSGIVKRVMLENERAQAETWVDQGDEGVRSADQEAATQGSDPLDMEIGKSESSEENKQPGCLP